MRVYFLLTEFKLVFSILSAAAAFLVTFFAVEKSNKKKLETAPTVVYISASDQTKILNPDY